MLKSELALAEQAQSNSDAFQMSLREILSTIPYNSATQFHAHFGDGKPDPRFGAACIFQTMEVARRAVDLGAPPPVLLQDERHVAAVFETDEEIVVLDPYLLHREPIRFPRRDLESGNAAVTVPASPLRHDRAGVVRDGRVVGSCKVTEDGYVIRLGYSRYSPTKDQYILSRHFSLRSGQHFNLDEFSTDMQRLLTDQEQTSVSIRAVLPGLLRTAEAIVPLRGFAERSFTFKDIWLRNSQGEVAQNGTNGSAETWDQLERALDLEQKDIVEHLVSAARIYQSIAQQSQELDPYRLEDE